MRCFDTEFRESMSTDAWFTSLEAEDRHALLSESDLLHLHTGEFIFRRGDPPNGFYGLVDGLAKASTLREDGKEAILVVLEPGNWFGEIAMIDGLPRSHDVVAMEPVRVRRLRKAAFESMMMHARFARAIALLQAMRMRGTFAFMEDLALRSTRARIARRLQRLVRGDAALGAAQARQVVPVTHGVLAMMLGITRQTLALELKHIAAEGAIVLGYRHIEIASMEKLRAIGRNVG